MYIHFITSVNKFRPGYQSSVMFETSHSRWRALQTRCESSRSAFVYGVITTRIYCRPNCPARLARRANVVFYDTAAEAAAAGFRPCKRCKPQEQQPDGTEDASQKAIRTACGILGQSSGTRTVNDLAEEVGLSPRCFYANFKKVMGLTPGLYMRQLKTAKEQSREKSSGDDGSRKRTELSSRGWLTLDGQAGEARDRATVAAYREGFESIPLLFLDDRLVEYSQPQHRFPSALLLRTVEPQVDDHWSNHDSSDSEISASNEAWLAQHNPLPLADSSFICLELLSSPLDIGAE